MRRWWLSPKKLAKLALIGGTAGVLATGCGPQYVVLHPAGPVAQKELNLMALSAVAMGVVILGVFVLFAVTVIRFRAKPGNRNPYLPNWYGHKWLEVLCFIVPAVILTVIAIPTVRSTYALDQLPKGPKPLVVDVTSLDWKWLFQYPGQKIASVNYLEIPAGRPVLFELTADSPMNTFWIPRLGGMEYTMPGRVLPLWLEANQPGTYWGRSGNFSGVGFDNMMFNVKAVSASAFNTWVAGVKQSQPPMTMQRYHQLLNAGTTGVTLFSAYPAQTFPAVKNGFTLEGGMYMVASNTPQKLMP